MNPAPAMVKVNAASLESFAPEYSVFSLPFLFRDRDHYYNVLKSDLGKRILASSRKLKGFVGLTWHDGGARSFTLVFLHHSTRRFSRYENQSAAKPQRYRDGESARRRADADGAANSIPRSSKAWSMAAKTTPWFMPICVMRRWRNLFPRR